VNARLYEFSIDEYVLKEDVKEFMQLAYKAYEAC